MRWFVKNRVLFTILFIVYFLVMITIKDISDGKSFSEIGFRYGLVLLGIVVGIVETSFMVRKYMSNELNQRIIAGIFLSLLLMFAVIGPILFLLFSFDEIETAGFAFIITGMTLTSKVIIKPDEEE